MPTLSVVKFGDIYVKGCHHESYSDASNETVLFPMNESPYLWPACDDAYYYTWTHDPTNRIQFLSELNKERLARSSGFCPHSRCQLGDLSNSFENGTCAQNLCYTKLERGRPSFGACCFVNSSFNSGDLIGISFTLFRLQSHNYYFLNQLDYCVQDINISFNHHLSQYTREIE